MIKNGVQDGSYTRSKRHDSQKKNIGEIHRKEKGFREKLTD